MEGTYCRIVKAQFLLEMEEMGRQRMYQSNLLGPT
jgi:hypothetical protein